MLFATAKQGVGGWFDEYEIASSWKATDHRENLFSQVSSMYAGSAHAANTSEVR